MARSICWARGNSCGACWKAAGFFPSSYGVPRVPGKTTLARMIARYAQAHFIQFSAVLSGVKEIREVVKEAEERSAG